MSIKCLVAKQVQVRAEFLNEFVRKPPANAVGEIIQQ